MFKKINNWFNRNRSAVAMVMFIASIVLSCFNIFAKVNSMSITAFTCCLTAMGMVIVIYDYQHKD